MLLKRVRRQPTWKAVQNMPGERQAKATAPSRARIDGTSQPCCNAPSRKLTSMLTNQTRLITGKAAVRSIKAEQEERDEQHFKTDHLLPNLKRDTISSAAVTMSA